ncbi:MAG: regulatory protein RecX [Rikenellaceae bacterium]
MGQKELKPRVKSESQALSSLMALCAKAERSSGDARRLMRGWGVDSSSAERVLKRLVEERFIDDSRYATLYSREKINLNGWGLSKISSGLYNKGVSREIIEQTLQDIDMDTLYEKLLTKLQRRLTHVKYSNIYELKGKLLRYAASQGYNYSMATQAIDEITKSIKE